MESIIVRSCPLITVQELHELVATKCPLDTALDSSFAKEIDGCSFPAEAMSVFKKSVVQSLHQNYAFSCFSSASRPSSLHSMLSTRLWQIAPGGSSVRCAVICVRCKVSWHPRRALISITVGTAFLCSVTALSRRVLMWYGMASAVFVPYLQKTLHFFASGLCSVISVITLSVKNTRGVRSFEMGKPKEWGDKVLQFPQRLQ